MVEPTQPSTAECCKHASYTSAAATARNPPGISLFCAAPGECHSKYHVVVCAHGALAWPPAAAGLEAEPLEPVTLKSTLPNSRLTGGRRQDPVLGWP
mmetsp:Transcript_26638/g.53525  ORF Transcript_26638/g.53525 Transcript_26638/m.53525 type:complete len:97 (+) Transcript_26638:1141-1431(+)